MNKPKKKKIIITAICVVIALYGIHFFRSGLYYVFSSDWERECQGEQFKELLLPCDPIDAVRLVPLYSQVNNQLNVRAVKKQSKSTENYIATPFMTVKP